MSKKTHFARTASFAAVLAIAATVTLTGCGTVSTDVKDKVDQTVGDGITAGDATSTENLKKLGKFADCMRDNGVSDFPDANKEDGLFKPSKEVTSNKNYDKAFDDCKSLLKGVIRSI